MANPINYSRYLGMNAKPVQDIFTQSLTQQYPLGTFFDDEWGRRFRYALNGAGALAAGDIVQSATLGGAATTLQTTASVAVASAATDTRIYSTALTTAQAADLFADGWVGIQKVSIPAAYTRLIKSHSYLDTTGTASFIDLYEPIGVALTTSDKLALHVNLYKNIIQGAVTATVATGMYLGGVHLAVDIANYCWVQTKGMFATHIKDGNLIGGPVCIAATTAATLTANTAALYSQQIGISPQAWLDEYAGLVMLMCE